MNSVATLAQWRRLRMPGRAAVDGRDRSLDRGLLAPYSSDHPLLGFERQLLSSRVQERLSLGSVRVPLLLYLIDDGERKFRRRGRVHDWRCQASMWASSTQLGEGRFALVSPLRSARGRWHPNSSGGARCYLRFLARHGSLPPLRADRSRNGQVPACQEEFLRVSVY